MFLKITLSCFNHINQNFMLLNNFFNSVFFIYLLTGYEKVKFFENLRAYAYFNYKVLNLHFQNLPKKNKSIAIFKAPLSLSSKTYLFKNYLRSKFYSLTKNFKFNKLFLFINYKKNNKIARRLFLNNSCLPSMHIFKLFFKLNCNWNFLIGNFIPYFSWIYSNFLSKIDKNVTFELKKNSSRVSNSNSFSSLLLKINNFTLQDMFAKNFYYFNALKINYRDLSYLVKNFKHAESFNVFYTHLTLKPYLFLNNKSHLPSQETFFNRNYWIYQSYKFYNDMVVSSLKIKNFTKNWNFINQIKIFNPTTAVHLFKFFNINPKSTSKKINFSPLNFLIWVKPFLLFSHNSNFFTDRVLSETRDFHSLVENSLIFLNFFLNKFIFSYDNIYQPNHKLNFLLEDSENLFWDFFLLTSTNLFCFEIPTFFYDNVFKDEYDTFSSELNLRGIDKNADLLNMFRESWLEGYRDYFFTDNEIIVSLDLYKNTLITNDFLSIREAYEDVIDVLNKDVRNVEELVFLINQWYCISKTEPSLPILPVKINTFTSFKKNVKIKYQNFLYQNTRFSSFKLNFFFNFKRETALELNKSLVVINESAGFKIEQLNVFKLLNQVSYFSYYQTNFLLFHEGFMYLTCSLSDSYLQQKTLSDLKKSLFSFTFTHEIHRYVIKNYLKNKTFDLVNAQSFKKNSSEAFFEDYKFFEKAPLATELFLKNNLTFFSKKSSILTSQLNSELSDYAILKSNPGISIKRIKFKPGYRRIWKNARAIIKSSLNLKYKYQYKLTQYLLKYNKFVKFKLFLSLEMGLLNIIKQSTFLHYNEFATNFIKHGLVFVNGLGCVNLSFQIYVNDFIQFIIHIKYYVSYKFILNFFLKKKLKLKIRIKKKMSSTNVDFGKKKSSTFPSWLLFEKNIENDVPKHFEIDFFTLSIFIVYEPFLISDLETYNLYEIKYNVINMYNWKYIT